MWVFLGCIIVTDFELNNGIKIKLIKCSLNAVCPLYVMLYLKK